MKKISVYFLFVCISFVSCKEAPTEDKNTFEPFALESLKKHMGTLASDEFEGRMPCSPGEEKTVSYLIDELTTLGLKPGNGSSYTQDVPLIEIVGYPDEKMLLDYGSEKVNIDFLDDFVIHSQRKANRVGIEDSELVFCGYGIVAPERGWNDFEGIDLKGKTAVVLVNDPGFGGQDSTFFKGSTMTYYGRWTYKYEEADRQGADGLLIIHETSSAGYPWAVVKSSWTGGQQGLSGIDRSNDCGVKGWISLDTAKDLFDKAGLDMAKEIRSARTKDFKAKSLKAKATVSIRNEYTECISKNVIATFPGTKRADEYIVYTAHWDHIGIGRKVQEDSIYNGALDNATGVTAVLEIAKAFTISDQKPERSIAFLFVTAEEQGLLGSEYYVKKPTIPLNKTVCNLNMDGVNPAGKMKDFTIVGMGHSEMDEYANRAAKAEGRYTMNEMEPEKGYFYRSDHFNFAKVGVPALYAEGGYDHWDKGKKYAMEFKEGYVKDRYHAPSDEFIADEWNFDGFVQDAKIYFNIGQTLANSEEWPKWYEGSEFRRAIDQ